MRATLRFTVFSNPILSKYFTTGISPAWLVTPCAVDEILTERVWFRTRDEVFGAFEDLNNWGQVQIKCYTGL